MFTKNIKGILLLAIPAMIENISQVLIGIVDTYFVGKLGTEAIAGVGVVNLIMNVYLAFFLALGIGTTAIVARNIGAGREDKAREYSKQSLILSIIIGLLFGIINLFFSKQLLALLGANEVVMKYALPYFLTVAVPCIFLCINIVLASALRGAGDTKTSMKIAIITNIINAILDYVLIFILDIGIIGAGLATTIARIISVILILRKIKIPLLSSWKINIPMMKSITKISIPAAAERLIMRSGQLIYGGMIIKIGVSSYAAHNIAGTIESLSYLPGMGFGVAAATLVGQKLGAGKKEEAKKDGYTSYILSAIFMVIIGIIFYIYAPNLANIFSKDTEVITQVVSVLRLIAFFQPFLAITLVTTAALQGAGDTKFPMYSSFIGIWGIRVIGVYILSIRLNYGLVGVWIAYCLDITIRGIILMIRYRRGKWQNIKIG